MKGPRGGGKGMNGGPGMKKPGTDDNKAADAVSGASETATEV